MTKAMPAPLPSLCSTSIAMRTSSMRPVVVAVNVTGCRGVMSAGAAALRDFAVAEGYVKNTEDKTIDLEKYRATRKAREGSQ